MELKEFVKNTLIEIVEGVKDAKEECKKLGGEVTPAKHGASLGVGEGTRYRPTQNIEFEVALSEMDKSGSNKGIGVALSVIRIGGDSNKEKEMQSLSKIKFSVEIKLP